MSRIAVLAAIAVLIASVADAQEKGPSAAANGAGATAAPTPSANYPQALVDRPQVLPEGMVRLDLSLGFTNAAGIDTGETLAVGVDLGLNPRLQAGFLVAFPINPHPDFGSVLGNIQARLTNEANLRVDFGVEREFIRAAGLVSGSVSQVGVTGGIGVPVKYKLNSHIAFVSGSTAARGFGTPVFLASTGDLLSVSAYASMSTLSNDVLAVFVESNNGSTAWAAVLTAPVGLIFQPHPIVSLSFRSGYRLIVERGSAFAARQSDTILQHAIPLALDLIVSPAKQVDLGFTATLQGVIATDGIASNASKQGYADVRFFDVWASAHF